MKILTKILDKVELAARGFTAGILALMLVVSLLEIVRRYIMGSSSIWTDELVKYCIVMVAMIGGAACFRKGELVAFTLLKDRIFGKARLALELVINTIVLGFAAFIFQNSVTTLKMPSIAKQISMGLRVSMKWFYLPITIGLLLIVIFAIEAYPRYIKAYKDGEYDKYKAIEAEGGESTEC